MRFKTFCHAKHSNWNFFRQINNFVLFAEYETYVAFSQFIQEIDVLCENTFTKNILRIHELNNFPSTK